MIYEFAEHYGYDYELLPSGRRFHVPKSTIVKGISEQINLFKRQSSVCVCVCVCVYVCATASASVCKLRKLLVYYVTFVFSITVLCKI